MWFGYNTSTEIKKPPIKILMIGNSFSLDATTYLHHMAVSAEIDVLVGILYRSGEGFEGHMAQVNGNLASYSFYKREAVNGIASQTIQNNVTLDYGVLDQDWDIITFQQRSGHSKDYSTYQPYLNQLKAHVESLTTNQKVEYGFLQTWAYSKTHTDDQTGMYNGIMDAYQQAMRDTDIDILIPSGTAIQNARTNSYLFVVDNELTVDGYHLGELGDYIAALCIFETLLSKRHKKDIFEDVTYLPNGHKKFLAYFGKVAVKNAVLNPFVVTKIQ